MALQLIALLLALVSAMAGTSKGAPDGGKMDQSKVLIDFGDTDRHRWYVINDGVMGGMSQSNIQRTDSGTGVFAGELSLANNGGFASVRAVAGRHDLSGYAGLEVRVRGDGRTYELLLRTNDHFDGIAWRARFDGGNGAWTTTRISFDEFIPTFRGRPLTNAARLDRKSIQQIGFMLANKQPGPFLLEIDSVRAWNSATID